MRTFSAVLLTFIVSASAISQSFDFECQPAGGIPNDPSQSCDGVVSNNRGLNSGVSNAPICGFPVSGQKYFDAFAAGPVSSPAGGPLVRPVSSNATELRIPIPAGSTVVSLTWNFFNAESGPQVTYNDGLSIDVVDPSGASVANLLYVDTNTALAASSTCSIPGEIAPAGNKALLMPLPLMPACSYVSIAIWNGGDNSYSSRALIDSVVFDSSLPSCAVPCVPVIGNPSLLVTSPFGIGGSIQVNMSSLPAGGTYFLAATLVQGAYPNGWFYGIDIPVADLGTEINAGAPFSGPISSGACNGGQAQIGPIFGAPTGLTFYLVAIGVPNSSLAGSPNSVTNAVAYTIP
jgi:hypothetical protein